MMSSMTNYIVYILGLSVFGFEDFSDTRHTEWSEYDRGKKRRGEKMLKVYLNDWFLILFFFLC